MKPSYSFEGSLYKAPEKKFKETVFFVHFYEGSKALLRKHISLVRSLGYDAFAFNLKYDFSPFHLPIASRGRIGVKHVYADEIEKCMNEVHGPKIVYAFSNPVAAAIEAMERRFCTDTVALIADSGPSGDLVKSIYSLYKEQNRLGPLPLRLAATPLLSLAWSPLLHKDTREQLSHFPQDFPVLSIRGWKDPLIPADQIDAIFENQPKLDWQKVALPAAGHLNGLRDFPDEYIPPLKRFLTEVSTPLVETP